MSSSAVRIPLHALRTTDPLSLGRHRVHARLGSGGMGVVYLADGPLGQVAIKVVRMELADNPDFRTRFQREVQACFRVGGTCTARLLDFDLTVDQPWLATEFLDAPTLAGHVDAHGALPEAAQLLLGGGLAEALVSIHAAGLIHRDLKPSNVIWTSHGPKVIDFGIAAARDTQPLTVTGTLVGTPGWLSPEQVSTGTIGTASDVFAWAGLVCYAATGEPPFGKGTIEAITYRIMNEEPRVDYNRVAPPLRDLMRQALSRDPQARPTAEQLRTEVLGRTIDSPGYSPAPGLADQLTRLLERGPDGSTLPDGPPATPPGTAPERISRPPVPARRTRWPHRRRLLVAALAAVLVAAATVATVTVLTADRGSADRGSADRGSADNSFTTTGPWRLNVVDQINGQDDGCTIALRESTTGIPVTLPAQIYGDKTFQIHQTGRFQWEATVGCRLSALPGSGTATLPFIQDQSGDTDAFAAPASGRVAVEVKDFSGNSECDFRLHDAATGQTVDVNTATPDGATRILETNGWPQVYLTDSSCRVKLSAAP